MRSSSLHRGMGLSIAALAGFALVGFASRAGAVWAVLAAVPVLTMLMLEASARRNPVLRASGARGDVLGLAPVAAVSHQATAELFDLAAYRAAHGPRSQRVLPEGHLAPVVPMPVREQRVERLRAHG